MSINKKVLLCALLYRNFKRDRKRRYCVHPVLSDRLSSGIFHTLHSKLKEHPDKFFKYYRMSEETFNEIISFVAPFIKRQDTIWRCAISVEERLSVTLRYLATGNSFNTLSFTYRIGATTIRDIVRDTCDQIWATMQPVYMPQRTEEDWVEIADQFYTRTNFPNVIGALDGKHIRLIQPNNSGSSFFNYKKYHSMVLMAWTDADYKFIYIDVGAYGGSCDSSVFKNSIVGKRLEENRLNIPNGRILPHDDNGKQMPFYLVADEAFGLSNNILRPYAKRGLSYEKKVYNYRHTRARRMVECTFGILANKWRIFHRALDVNLDFAGSIIKTCCVLHNLVRIKDGIQFTDTLYDAPLENIICHGDNRGRNLNGGINVRQYLTSYFVSPQGSVPWQYDVV